MKKDAWVGIEPVFTQNYPANLLEESQIAGNLSGITSRETQLKVLSVVDNIQQEIERIEEEETSQQDTVMQQIFGGVTKDEQPGILEEPGSGTEET